MLRGRNVRIALVVGALVGTMAVCGCGGGGGGGDSGAQTKGLTTVKLQLPWTMLGGYDPFALAQEAGYYKAEGLNVVLDQGSGSSTAVESVASGSGTLALADAGTAATLISKGAKAKVIAVYQQRTPLAIIHRKSLNISSLASLKGKTIIHGASDNATAMFNALLAKAHLSWSDFKQTIVASTAYERAFLSNPDAVLLGNVNSNYQAIKTKDHNATATSYARFGFTGLSQGLIARTDTIRSDGDLLRRFIAATNRGFEAAIRNPDQAVAAAAKMFPEVVGPARAAQRAQLTSSLPLLHTDRSQGHPLGWMAPKDWEATLGPLQAYGGLKKGLPPSAFYTNSLIPSS